MAREDKNSVCLESLADCYNKTLYKVYLIFNEPVSNTNR